MTRPDDIEALAGEYVLGTLSMADRADVAARRLAEADLDAAIGAWERRLAPMADGVLPVAPPAWLKERILQSIGAADTAGSTVIDLQRRLKRWKGAALVASALAASLALVVASREFAPKPPSQTLVAVLQKDAASPAFLVSVDIDKRTLTVRPVAAKHEAGRSHELWIVHDSLGAPRSLGVLDDTHPVERPTLAAYQPSVIESATFAVSLEPEGGSPTGAPTGPVVYAGKLIPAFK